MLAILANSLRVPEIRKKLAFTAAMLLLYRIGAYIPAPGINVDAVESISENFSGSNVLGFLNLFSGGALTRFAVFGLGIMPYITSSIIMQLLTVVIPKLEQWQKQGEVGVKKITQWTRYMTVTLALLQSTGLIFLINNENPQVLHDFTPSRVAFMVMVLTAGTALIIEGSGRHVTPGLVDAHNHSMVLGAVNEATIPSTAMVRIGDVINSESLNIHKQLAGGLTTLNLLHGSANPIGGQNAKLTVPHLQT